MKKILLFGMGFLLFSSCNYVTQKQKDAVDSLAEKMIEKSTDGKIDASSLANMNKNKATFDFQIDNLGLASVFDEAKGYMLASPGELTITISSESGEDMKKRMTLSFLSKRLSNFKPLIGKANEQDDMMVTFYFVISESENEMSYIMQEGEGVLESFTENQVVIKLDGKIAALSDVGYPEKWQHLKGKIIIDYPVLTSTGIDIKQLMYQSL